MVCPWEGAEGWTPASPVGNPVPGSLCAWCAHQVQAGLVYFPDFGDNPHFPPGNGIPEHQCFAGPTLHNLWLTKCSITGTVAVYVTFWCHSRTLSALTSFWFRFHTPFRCDQVHVYVTNNGSNFCCYGTFHCMSTFFPFDSLLLFHSWGWILPSNTRFPFTWLQGFFLVASSVKKTPRDESG